MKIYFFVYRNWAFQIAKVLKKKYLTNDIEIFTIKRNEIDKSEIIKNNVRIINNKDNKKIYSFLKKKNPEIIFYLGWSEIIDRLIYKNFLCICMHPSKLPSFRGGSPLQNQIIRNVKQSALTLFKINRYIDGGPISHQSNLSLLGDIPVIFKRIEKKGVFLIRRFISDFIKKRIVFIKQNRKDLSIYKRRKPRQSYFSLKTIKTKKITYFQNLIRMLGSPYPNAFTVIKNHKIIIQKIKKTNNPNPKLSKINFINNKNADGFVIDLNNSKVKILKSDIVYYDDL